MNETQIKSLIASEIATNRAALEIQSLADVAALRPEADVEKVEE